MKKLLSYAVTALIAIPLALAAAQPASASGYGDCSIELPSRLVVDAPYKKFIAHLGTNCSDSGAEYASWDIYHTYHGWDGIFIFDNGATTDTWDFYDWDYTGTYEIRPSSSWDYNYNDLDQNTAYTVVKFGSRLSVSSVRSGKYVTLSSSASRYKPSASGFRAWAGVPVRFSYRTCKACAWHTFKTAKTDRYGKVSVRFRQAKKRQYQTRVADTSTVWGHTSRTVSR